MTNNSLREEEFNQKFKIKMELEQSSFVEQFCKVEGDSTNDWLVWNEDTNPDDALDFIVELICAERKAHESELSKAHQQAEKEIAQECYLQCLAAECGEGECAEAIYTKFPKLISRFDSQ